MSEHSKPVQGKNEERLSFKLRMVAWRRSERKRKREAADAPKKDSVESSPPEEDRRSTIDRLYNKSADALKEMGE